MIYERHGIAIEHDGTDLSQQHLGFIFDEMYDLAMYDSVNVAGKDVLDVGAYYGETAVFFSKRGAKRVIAVEPFNSATYIEKNAERNLCDNIIAVRAVYAAYSKPVAIQGNFPNHGATRLFEGQFWANDANKMTVPGMTLRDLVDAYGLQNAVLKMDVEGAERDGIVATDRDTLRHFSQIVLEYHFNPMFEGDSLVNFEKHLGDAGFTVWHKSNKQMVTMVYADRQD